MSCGDESPLELLQEMEPRPRWGEEERSQALERTIARAMCADPDLLR